MTVVCTSLSPMALHCVWTVTMCTMLQWQPCFRSETPVSTWSPWNTYCREGGGGGGGEGMNTGKYLLLHPLDCGVSALQLQGAAPWSWACVDGLAESSLKHHIRSSQVPSRYQLMIAEPSIMGEQTTWLSCDYHVTVM